MKNHVNMIATLDVVQLVTVQGGAGKGDHAPLLTQQTRGGKVTWAFTYPKGTPTGSNRDSDPPGPGVP